jgi:hypothetical protein
MVHRSVVDLDAGFNFAEPSSSGWAGALFLLPCIPMVSIRRSLLRIHRAVRCTLATPYGLTYR